MKPTPIPWTGFLVSCVVAVGCNGSTRDAGLPPLSEGVVATAGPERIDAASVERVATDQRITPSVALNGLVEDALLAMAATDRLGAVARRRAESSARARALLEAFVVEAKRRGAPTDAEVEVATARRWWELDRPPMLRTTHVVVLVKKPEDDARAHALADRIAAAVAKASSPAAFRKAALAVPANGLDVRVEDLDPVARDGRSVDPGSPPPPGSQTAEYSMKFVHAAFAIPGIGLESPVTRSEFGYHVILAVALIPAHRVSLEERRRLLASEVVAARERDLEQHALVAARAREHVDVERSALELTEQAKAGE